MGVTEAAAVKKRWMPQRVKTDFFLSWGFSSSDKRQQQPQSLLSLFFGAADDKRSATECFMGILVAAEI